MKKLTDLSWNVSEEEYRQDNSYSYSMLAKFNREGFENLDKLFDKISTPSLTFGSIVDCLLTYEQNFENRFVVCGNNDLSDTLKSYIKSYNNSDTKLYVVSVDDAVNKFVKSDSANETATNYSELKISKNTLITINGGKISSYLTNEDEIKEKLK